MKIFLQGGAVRRGHRQVPLVDVGVQVPALQPIITELLNDGFVHFHEASSGQALELASRALQEMFATSRIDRSAVDAVLFVCENLDDVSLAGDEMHHPAYSAWPRRVASWLASQELDRAYLLGNWMSGCGNLLSSFAVARGLLAQSSMSNVVVSIVDTAAALEPAQRFTGSTVLSDAASCCLVTNRPQPGWAYLLEDIVLHADAQLLGVDRREEKARHLIGFQRGLSTAKRRAEEQFGKACSDFDIVLVPNLKSGSLSVAAEILGVPAYKLSRVETESGHAFGTDHIAALSRYLGSGELQAESHVLLFNPGVFCWNFASLRHTFVEGHDHVQ